MRIDLLVSVGSTPRFWTISLHVFGNFLLSKLVLCFSVFFFSSDKLGTRFNFYWPFGICYLASNIEMKLCIRTLLGLIKIDL